MLARLKNFWTPIRLLDALVVALVIYVTVWSLHPSLLFSSSLITGGDTGAHVVLPAYLKSQGDIFNLTPWYPGWFAGMPAYTYYFVLPDILATLASYVIGFAVAFKLATILGSVLMPITAYAMGRLFRAPRPVPAALAVATLPFLFDATFTIDGGNLFSTMAGEYAFSLSLALCLLTIGLFARGVRTGRGYWWAAIALSATLASHLLPWLFAIVAVGVVVVFELLQRRGLGDPKDADMVTGDFARPVRFALGAGLISLALSAWWLLSFATTQSLTNSMGYTNDNVSTLRAVFTTLGWFTSNGAAAGDRWVIVARGRRGRRGVRGARPTGDGARHPHGLVAGGVRLRPPERDLERTARAVLVHLDPPHRRVAGRLPALPLGPATRATPRVHRGLRRGRPDWLRERPERPGRRRRRRVRRRVRGRRHRSARAPR